MRKATVDVGSNSVLLLVAEKSSSGWQTVFESTAVTALGEGVKQTGVLSERGMVDTLHALKRMFVKARELGASDIQAAATMAARMASNTPDFQRRAEEQGSPVSVLSGDDEARLGFLAVANDPIFRGYPRLSIIDPGGQSTELTTAQREGDEWIVLFRRSYPIGTLALRGGLLSDEMPRVMEMLRASREIDDTIGMCYLPNHAGQAVVLGATGTNLISIREKLLTWQPARVHGAALDFEEISNAFAVLASMTDAERAAIPGMEIGREKTIHLGALILEKFLFAIRVEGCSVSVRGWRHALLESS